MKKALWPDFEMEPADSVSVTGGLFPNGTQGQENLMVVATEAEPSPFGAAEHPGDSLTVCWKKKFRRKKCWAIATVLLLFLVLVSIAPAVWKAITAGAATPSSATPPPCPSVWILNEETCYFFSDTEATWNVSQRNCSSVGGFLVTMETQQEKDFVLRSKNHTYIWIGLWREDVGQPWKRPNGSLFSNWFPIRGEGCYAYLNEERISSTWCTNSQFWICSKPALAAGGMLGAVQISEG